MNNCLICVITISITIRTAKGKIYAEIYQEIKNTKSDKVQMVARKLLVDRKEKAECK